MRYPNSTEASYLTVFIYRALQKPGEVEKFHKFIVEKPHEVIVELGTCHGGMTWFFAHLPHFKKLISVDLPGGDFGGGTTQIDLDIMRNWCSTDYNVTLCSGDSHKKETLEEVKAELPNGTCDLLFIDADHTYEGVKRDYELWAPLVRPGGHIAFHDIADHSKSYPTCKVNEFWAELKTQNPNTVFHELRDPTDPDWAGIGVMEVR